MLEAANQRQSDSRVMDMRQSVSGGPITQAAWLQPAANARGEGVVRK